MFQNRDMGQEKLTEIERSILRSFHKKNMKAKEADKIKAILLLDDGYSQQEIANILLIDENTVTNWKKDFLNRKDLNDWLKDNYTGYHGKLNEEEKQQVDKFVDENLIQSSEQVQKFIHDEFNKNYSISGITNLLHNLEFVYKDTTHIPSKYDIDKQKAFKEAYEIFEKNLHKNEVILFGDAAHPQHNTKPSKVWVKKGKEKVIKSNTGRNKLNINGLYNPHNQDFMYSNDETVNAENTIELFKQAEAKYKDKKRINIFVDNAPYYKSKTIQEFLFNSTKIRLIHIPVYSPNLNLIERLWKFLRKKKINLIYYEKFSDFKYSVLNFLDNLHEFKDGLRSFIGTRLHLLDLQKI